MSQKQQKIVILVTLGIIWVGIIKNMVTQIATVLMVESKLADSNEIIDGMNTKLSGLEEEVRYASSEMGISRNKRQILGDYLPTDIVIKEKIPESQNNLYLTTTQEQKLTNWQKWLKWFTK